MLGVGVGVGVAMRAPKRIMGKARSSASRETKGGRNPNHEWQTSNSDLLQNSHLLLDNYKSPEPLTAPSSSIGQTR
jgi:hypothetical protein